MGLEVLSMKFAFYPVTCRQGEWDEGQKGEGTHLKTVGIIHNSFQRVVGKRVECVQEGIGGGHRETGSADKSLEEFCSREEQRTETGRECGANRGVLFFLIDEIKT